MTIAEMGRRLRARETSCVLLLEEAHARIAEFDDDLNAFISVIDEPAGVRARLLDRELAEGADRGPLHGIPIAVKDNLNTRGIRTTAGSKIFEDHIPDSDAFVVEQLERAGAIIVGKTNLHELAYGVTSNNPHYGAVHNPYRLNCIPGGSSGGSGAAVAAGVVPAALGTDTGGSVRIPAAYCGTFGLKTTYGRVSKYGCVPLGLTLDTIGPLAASAACAAALMNAIAGYDPRDVASVRRAAEDYTPSRRVPQGLRIGWPENGYFDMCDPQIRAACEQAGRHLETGGARLERIRVPDLAELNTTSRMVLLAEASAVMQSVAQERDKIGADVLALFDQGRLLPATDYVNAQRLRARLVRDFQQVFERVDVLLTPSIPITAPEIGASTVHLNGKDEDVRLATTVCMRGVNLLGLPAAACPAGLHSNGLPMSVQLIGRPFSEQLLLTLAAHLETAFGEMPAPPRPMASAERSVG